MRIAHQMLSGWLPIRFNQTSDDRVMLISRFIRKKTASYSALATVTCRTWSMLLHVTVAETHVAKP